MTTPMVKKERNCYVYIWTNSSYRISLQHKLRKSLIGEEYEELIVKTLPKDDTHYKTFAAGQLEYQGTNFEEAMKHVHMYYKKAEIDIQDLNKRKGKYKLNKEER